jgi:hypothetical protein
LYNSPRLGGALGPLDVALLAASAGMTTLPCEPSMRTICPPVMKNSACGLVTLTVPSGWGSYRETLNLDATCAVFSSNVSTQTSVPECSTD